MGADAFKTSLKRLSFFLCFPTSGKQETGKANLCMEYHGHRTVHTNYHGFAALFISLLIIRLKINLQS
jgi:hypothetical protein